MTPDQKLLALETWLQMREDAVMAVDLYRKKIEEQVELVVKLNKLIGDARRQGLDNSKKL